MVEQGAAVANGRSSSYLEVMPPSYMQVVGEESGVELHTIVANTADVGKGDRGAEPPAAHNSPPDDDEEAVPFRELFRFLPQNRRLHFRMGIICAVVVGAGLPAWLELVQSAAYILACVSAYFTGHETQRTRTFAGAAMRLTLTVCV